MALYCLKSRPLQRSKGHSATGLGCYMLDMSAIDPYTEKKYAQEDRHEHAMSVMSFYPGDEDPFSSPIEVFQAIDAFEKRKDASLGKEYEIALQNELTREQNIETVKSFCQQIVDSGKYAVASIHWKNDNPHVHVYETDRALEIKDGKIAWGRKNNTPQANLDLLNARREHWQQCVNTEFEKAGLDLRIDHRSNKERGIEFEREIHEGRNPSESILEHNARVREDKIERSQKIIEEIDNEISELKTQEKTIISEIERIISEIKERIPFSELFKNMKPKKEEVVISTPSSLKTEETTAKQIRKDMMKFLDNLGGDDMPQVTAAKKAAAEKEQEENASPQRYKSLIEKLGMKPEEKQELKGGVRVASKAHTTPAPDATPTSSPDHYRRMPPKPIGHGFSRKNEPEYTPSPWDRGPR